HQSRGDVTVVETTVDCVGQAEGTGDCFIPSRLERAHDGFPSRGPPIMPAVIVARQMTAKRSLRRLGRISRSHVFFTETSSPAMQKLGSATCAESFVACSS